MRPRIESFQAVTELTMAQLGPIIQGTMADGVGWRSFWWLNVALNVFTLLILLVALPETKWDRSDTREPSGDQTTPQVFTSEEEKPTSEVSPDSLENQNQTISGSKEAFHDAHLLRGKPSKQQWQVFQNCRSPFSTLLRSFWVPWRLLTFPIVVFASFIVGFSGSCYLLLTFVQSQAFGSPPYNFSPQSVGFMNFASLVGALIGLLTAGPLSDWISAKLTVRNHGIREPEMRLVAMIPYVVVMILGNFIAGFGFQYHWDWRVRLGCPFSLVTIFCLQIGIC